MKILMLTDSMNIGGAETHISALISSLRSLGHSVLLVSSGGLEADRLHCPRLTLPLSSRSPLSLLACRSILSALLEHHSFDVIHSHSRITSFLISPLAKKRSIPLVCTAHAKFSLSPLRRRLSCWGVLTIAVSEDIKQYLADFYSLPPENISVIHNGIDLSRFSPIKAKPRPCPSIGFLSRLDGDCSDGAYLLCSLAPRLVSALGKIRILIGGGGSEYSSLCKRASQINSSLGFECISPLGSISDVPRFMSRCDIFIGVSRAAIEASLCNIPVILCGNEGYFGILTKENFTSALSTNLCGRGCERMRASQLLADIFTLLKAPTPSLRSLMAEHFDSCSTALKALEVYKKASLMLPSPKSDLLLCGYYGFSNMGDDILLRSAVHRAYTEFPRLSVGALTKRGSPDSSRFGIRCIKRSSPSTVLRELSHCKYFVLGGGTLLQDRTSKRSLLYYTSLMALAKCLGARILLWGNGIGALSSPLSRHIVAKALSGCDYVGLRDRLSVNTASLLAPEAPIYQEYDLALHCDPATDSRCDYLLKCAFGRAIPDYIVVAPKASEGLKELKQALSSASIKDKSLLFVPMHKKADTALAHRLCQSYGGACLENICYSDLLALVKSSKGVLSMRLHALIAAKSLGIPYRAFGDDIKLTQIEVIGKSEEPLRHAKRATVSYGDGNQTATSASKCNSPASFIKFPFSFAICHFL